MSRRECFERSAIAAGTAVGLAVVHATLGLTVLSVLGALGLVAAYYALRGWRASS